MTLIPNPASFPVTDRNRPVPSRMMQTDEPDRPVELGAAEGRNSTFTSLNMKAFNMFRLIFRIMVSFYQLESIGAAATSKRRQRLAKMIPTVWSIFGGSAKTTPTSDAEVPDDKVPSVSRYACHINGCSIPRMD